MIELFKQDLLTMSAVLIHRSILYQSSIYPSPKYIQQVINYSQIAVCSIMFLYKEKKVLLVQRFAWQAQCRFFFFFLK